MGRAGTVAASIAEPERDRKQQAASDQEAEATPSNGGIVSLTTRMATNVVLHAT